MSVHDLLPPNATPLERDLARASNFLPELGPPAEAIRAATILSQPIPPSVIGWLIYEYGLDEISEYHPDLLTALRRGVPWQWIRGTPQSIIEAISWLGIAAQVDESDSARPVYPFDRWPEFQVELDRARTTEQLRDVVALARLSAPARSPLQRVFAFYDFRRFVLSDHGLSSGAILSDHSGVRPPELGGFVQVSFGRPFQQRLDFGLTVAGATSMRLWSLEVIRGASLWVLSQTAVLSDSYHEPSDPTGHTRLYSAQVLREVLSSTWLATPWPAASWEAASQAVSARVRTLT
ncbi:phage tail protein [Cyanobium sp. N5-Cardenillas]|uniref:phage tail protein n=1 Tax=Cyanobium sp. N5-Cardenillas TaxID=2823720 RepID=UPI0020CC0778|nr:phage tail protein [Cyanobium sp. N5-Cardenillas]MCP9785405.1 hypothetical protein [Cyanobium sp. N5-Cardenillas]